jgi:hypothetical protein
MPYFQENFGVSLTSSLLDNHFGLWAKQYESLHISNVEKPVTTSFIFRPLCTSKYVVVGVFQGEEMDKQDCFGCSYGFELYDLKVEKHHDPQADFVYLCDAFEDQRLERKFMSGFDIDTVYFKSRGADINNESELVLDAIPGKLRTKQDLVSLYAYTDKEGIENDSLGAARNASVRQALISRGVDSIRIRMVNYGETRALAQVNAIDRRVEIQVNSGKLYQLFYTEAIQAATRDAYNEARANLMFWSTVVPPKNAIYALFDCWGKGNKEKAFRNDLLYLVRSRAYPKGDELKFTFDSLYCEDQKGRTLSMYVSMNHLPDFPSPCQSNFNVLNISDQGMMIDSIYAVHGFPSVEKVGQRGNKVLPYMIIHASDTVFQNKYLPILKKACEEERISWEFYAMLYDKINVARNGKQRYGTQWAIDENGVLGGMIPFEDEVKVHEYRKQVGLVPLSDF